MLISKFSGALFDPNPQQPDAFDKSVDFKALVKASKKAGAMFAESMNQLEAKEQAKSAAKWDSLGKALHQIKQELKEKSRKVSSIKDLKHSWSN